MERRKGGVKEIKILNEEERNEGDKGERKYGRKV
jgi:hypothetical protein